MSPAIVRQRIQRASSILLSPINFFIAWSRQGTTYFILYYRVRSQEVLGHPLWSSLQTLTLSRRFMVMPDSARGFEMILVRYIYISICRRPFILHFGKSIFKSQEWITLIPGVPTCSMVGTSILQRIALIFFKPPGSQSVPFKTIWHCPVIKQPVLPKR